MNNLDRKRFFRIMRIIVVLNAITAAGVVALVWRLLVV